MEKLNLLTAGVVVAGVLGICYLGKGNFETADIKERRTLERACLNKADTNSDGQLDSEELKTMYGQINENLQGGEMPVSRKEDIERLTPYAIYQYLNRNKGEGIK